MSVAWHARESLTGGRRDGSKLTQVRYRRGRGAGWVKCGGKQLVRSGHGVASAACERESEREWCCNFTSQNSSSYKTANTETLVRNP